MRETFHLRKDRDPYGDISIGHGDLEEISQDDERQMIGKMLEFVRERDIEELKAVIKRLKRADEDEKYRFFMVDPFRQEDRDKLKYSEKQIENEAWTKRDEKLALSQWSKEKWPSVLGQARSRVIDRGAQYGRLTRLEVETEILNDLENGKPVAISGLFGMGKSQIAEALLSDVYGTRHSLHFDVATDKSVEQLLSDASNEITKLFAMRAHESDEAVQARAKHLMSDCERQGITPFAYLEQELEQENDSVLVIFDEVSGASPEVQNFIVSLKEFSHIKLVCLFQGGSSMRREMKELCKDFSQHFLKPLSLQETSSMIHRYFAETPFIISDPAIERVWRISGGFPRVIEIFFANFLIELSKEPRLIFRVDDIERFFFDVCENDKYFLGLGYDGDFYQYYRNLTIPEQEIIKKILRGGQVGVSDASAREEKAFLESIGLIRKDVKKKRYVINGELFEEFLKALDSQEGLPKGFDI